MQIQTERLILRELSRDDYAALHAVLSDADVMRHYPHAFDEAEVISWIDKNIERYKTFGFGLWAVTLKHSGELIGDCGLTMQNINAVIKPEIGFHINKKYWRQGYAKEAAVKCRNWAFENTPFQILYSYMNEANIASCATAKSIGMNFLCRYTDNQNTPKNVYAISRNEWSRAEMQKSSKA